MLWRASSFCAIAAVALVTVVSSQSSRADDIEQHLRDEYQGKISVLRGFYSGGRLSYDSSGALVSTATSGDWTSDGLVRVEHLRLSHQHLTIETKRQLVIQLEAKSFQLLEDRDLENRHLKIEADMGGLSIEQADAAMAKIFLTAQDELANLVSDYWKPCVRVAAAGKDPSFTFSSELLRVPGVAATGSNGPGAIEPSKVLSANCGSQGVGVKRATPPRAIYSTSPEFSDRARREKYQGVVVLTLVVNEEGLPEYVHITKPLGLGLDEEALDCVKKWRFKPGEKDGQPVSTQISVEVDFHLF